ncbi:hypothetical protein Ancab_017642 [Ancistrocladus abbreviatus]
MAGSKLVRMAVMRKARPVERGASSLTGPLMANPAAEQKDATSRKETRSSNKEVNMESSDWVPHPRTGIYFPKGHDWVMDDVPDHAALPGKTYWLRNIDGVEKPDPDLPSDHYLAHPFFDD